MKKLLALLCLLYAWPVGAQTVYNPTLIEFSSPDHDTQVTNYAVEYWMQGVDPTTGSPVSAAFIDKTKMTVVAGSSPLLYRVLLSDFSPILGIPVGPTYVARVKAIGPGGESPRSAPSNPFASAVAPATPTSVSIR